MATQQRRRKRKAQELYYAPTQETETKSEWSEWLDHARENPWIYIGGVAFVLLSAFAGILFRVNAEAQRVEVITAYAQTLETEDPALRSTELEQLAENAGGLRAEILYMAAEAAFEAGDHDRAAELFELIQENHGDTEFAALSVEGLGYIAEDAEDYEIALERYQQLREGWPATYAGRRVLYRIGKIHEKLGDIEEAAAAYQQQLTTFPGSNTAARAQSEWTRLHQRYPDQVEDPFAIEALEDVLAEDDPTAPLADPMMDMPPGPPIDGPPIAGPDEAPPATPMEPGAPGEMPMDPQVIPMEPGEEAPGDMPLEPQVIPMEPGEEGPSEPIVPDLDVEMDPAAPETDEIPMEIPDLDGLAPAPPADEAPEIDLEDGPGLLPEDDGTDNGGEAGEADAPDGEDEPE